MRQLLLLFLTLPVLSLTQRLCGARLCDGDGADSVQNGARSAYTVTIFGREISIWLSDSENVAFGRITNGNATDELWLDRSFDGGDSWSSGSRLGSVTIPNNAREATTPVFVVDGAVDARQLGVLRACGKPGNQDQIECTTWARSTVHAGSPAEGAATALMQKYNSGGLWDTTGWWNAANCLTALIDYIKLSGDNTYMFAINRTYEQNKYQASGDFRNEYLDDTGWWGLVWVGAYDLTQDQKYLNTARATANYMHDYIDGRCNGGVYWSTGRTYKNAITNELFVKLAAALHNRLPGDTQYLQWAQETLAWFEQSGMINEENLINDGLDDNCMNNNDTTWTYNQGAILGAYAELSRANSTAAGEMLTRATRLADTTTASGYISPNGILHEPCDHDGVNCSGNGQSFKGVYARNLGELHTAIKNAKFQHPGYSDYIRRNADSISKNGNSINQYGLHYEGPFEFFSAATQHSAFEMLTASLRL